MPKSYFARRFLSQNYLFVYSRGATLGTKALLLCTALVYIAYSIAGWHGLPSDKLIQLSGQPHHESDHVATLSDTVSEASSLDAYALSLNLKARDSDYSKAYVNGRRFMCDIENYDINSRTYPPQSQWTTPEQLEDYGWSNEPFLGEPEVTLTNIAPALAELGLSQNLAGWEVVDDNHFPYTPPGSTTRVKGTGARFAVFYNFRQGAIICQNTRAPRQTPLAMQYNVPIPLLERLSDNLFINWFRLAGPDPGLVGALKYVFRFAIQNPTTMAVISAIATKNNINIGGWPGFTFPMSENEAGADGVALLGTPNGAAVAFLLSQHKVYFLDKTVSSVTVWTADNPDIEEDQKILTHMVFNLITPIMPPNPEKWGCCDN